MIPLADVIDAHAARQPDAPAFATHASELTWAQYGLRSDRLAARLCALGLEPGARVAVLLPDGPGVHIAFVACEKAGLPAVGISPRAARREIQHLLARTGAAAFVTGSLHRDEDTAALVGEMRRDGLVLAHHIIEDRDFEDVERDAATPLDPARRIPVDAPFLLNSTSGTTGLPKCVVHDQRRWNHFHDLAVEAGELTSNDVFLSAVPAPYGFGIWTAHVTPALLGAPAVLMPRFTPQALLDAIERRHASVLAAVSTQFIMLLDAPDLGRRDLSSLRVLFTGGERVPYERAAEFEDRTGAAVLQFYGSNETGALSRTTTRDSRDVRLRSAGHVIESMQVRLFDADGRDVTPGGLGRAGCNGPLLSQGYYRDPEANRALYTKDGWMLTGDIVTLDADGVLHVVGREGDFIIRGGKNVSGPAVEEAVATHPAVALAAAVAMPDPTFGERVCVYAVLRAGAALDLDALVEHLRERGVSPETWPERLVLVDELPRSSGGKIHKASLREDIRRRLAEEDPR